MKLKAIVTAALVAASVLTGSVQAAPMWTVSMQGTIQYGWDYAGFFGTAGQDLAGLQYTQTITATVDTSQHHGWGMESQDLGHRFTSSSSELWGWGTSTPFTETLTVNGKTLTLTVPSYYYAVQTITSATGPNPRFTYSSFDSDNEGTTGSDYIVAINQAKADDPADMPLPRPDFNQAFASASPSANGYDGRSYFFYSVDGDALVELQGTPHSVALNGGVAPADVPEPASIALLGLGLAGVGLIRHRMR